MQLVDWRYSLGERSRVSKTQTFTVAFWLHQFSLHLRKTADLSMFRFKCEVMVWIVREESGLRLISCISWSWQDRIRCLFKIQKWTCQKMASLYFLNKIRFFFRFLRVCGSNIYTVQSLKWKKMVIMYKVILTVSLAASMVIVQTNIAVVPPLFCAFHAATLRWC